MKKYIIGLILAGLLAITGTCTILNHHVTKPEVMAPAYQVDPSPIPSKQADCDVISHYIVKPTVELFTDDGGSGTGVVISQNRGGSKILTAYHVIQGARAIRAQQTIDGHSNFGWGLTVLLVDAKLDLAILSSNTQWAGVATIISKASELRQHVEAFTYGFPGSLDGLLSHGYVGQLREDHWNESRILTSTSVPVALGNSGGGLFIQVDGQWKLAGVLSIVLVQRYGANKQMVNHVSGFVTAKDTLEFIARSK